MTTEPPDTCPICGAAIIQRAERPTDVDYACGLSWYQAMTGRFLNDCRYATRAALRCGATLRPTAREQATASLVGGAVNGLTGHDITSLDIHYLRQLAYAYIATLEPHT